MLCKNKIEFSISFQYYSNNYVLNAGIQAQNLQRSHKMEHVMQCKSHLMMAIIKSYFVDFYFCRMMTIYRRKCIKASVPDCILISVLAYFEICYFCHRISVCKIVSFLVTGSNLDSDIDQAEYSFQSCKFHVTLDSFTLTESVMLVKS